jgi:hypothetical protein
VLHGFGWLVGRKLVSYLKMVFPSLQIKYVSAVDPSNGGRPPKHVAVENVRIYVYIVYCVHAAVGISDWNCGGPYPILCGWSNREE